jgi:hypothetical protein
VGSFYVNFTTRGPKREAVAQCLRSAERTAFVGPTLDHVTVFFDEKSDTQDDAVIKALGARASGELNAPVFAVLNHDDDILAYWLFEGGELADEYNSCPGYFTDEGGDAPEGGDAKKLCAAFGDLTQANAVEKVLRDEEYVFALERHEALAALLKHPWPYVCMGYRYIKEGSLAEGVSEKDLLAIG